MIESERFDVNIENVVFYIKKNRILAENKYFRVDFKQHLDKFF